MFVENSFISSNMKQALLSLIILILSICASYAQQSPYWELGLEIQQYPTGTQPGVRLEWSPAVHHGIDLRLGYNIVYHRDLGVQDNEEGGGFGFSGGYRYYFQPNHNRLFLGGRVDFWFNEVDWEDQDDQGQVLRTGVTNLVVLQPTVLIGYAFVWNHFVLSPTLAFGMEINVVEDGEDVGEGPIGLIGVTAGYRF